jgi:hypothetical protein
MPFLPEHMIVNAISQRRSGIWLDSMMVLIVIYGLPIVRKTVQWIIQRLQPIFRELHFRAAGLPPRIKKREYAIDVFEILEPQAMPDPANAFFLPGRTPPFQDEGHYFRSPFLSVACALRSHRAYKLCGGGGGHDV